jgi:hypothetical protein
MYMFMDSHRAANRFATFPARTKILALQNFTTARGEIHAR